MPEWGDNETLPAYRVGGILRTLDGGIGGLQEVMAGSLHLAGVTKFSACVFGTKEQMRGGEPQGLSGMPGSSSVTGEDLCTGQGGKRRPRLCPPSQWLPPFEARFPVGGTGPVTQFLAFGWTGRHGCWSLSLSWSAFISPDIDIHFLLGGAAQLTGVSASFRCGWLHTAVPGLHPLGSLLRGLGALSPDCRGEAGGAGTPGMEHALPACFWS